MSYHTPVLLAECIDGLEINPDGTYVDVTFGGGGHSQEIFKKLDKGHLVVFDQDPDAKINAEKLKNEDPQGRSFTFIEANFRYLKKYLKFYGISKVDGILADLGVSSFQLDENQRGFSTRFEGDLDMRMDKSGPKSAKTVVNEYDEKDLVHLLSAYGEIKNAKTLARAIVQKRSEGQIETTNSLKDVALTVAPKGKEFKYLAQVFQAIRIEVNEEMEVLKDFLEQCPEVLNENGRLVVMSYHSLEDRLVKNFINAGNISGKVEKDFYGNLIRPLEPTTRKPIIPNEAEINENSRARSAKLRIAIKRDGN